MDSNISNSVAETRIIYMLIIVDD